jgi:hypothetical protein
MQPEHQKDPRAAVLGQRGGQKHMAQLSARLRSALARHATYAKHHPHRFRRQQEQGAEIARVVKQAIDDYLPDNNDLLHSRP